MLGDVFIAYSIKTNSFQGVVEKLGALESGFDIASVDELALVKRKKCLKIFNGPAKTMITLKKALGASCLIVVDSLSELEKIIALQSGKKTDIMARIALKESKLGVDREGLKRFMALAASNNISIIGLHFHSGTQLSLTDFEKNFVGIYSFLKEFFRTYPHIHLKYLDLGGGFADRFYLKTIGGTLSNYFETIRDSLGDLREHYENFIFEPGRVLVSDAFCLITQVVAIKENFDRRYAILDAGINLLPKISLSHFNFSKYPASKKNVALTLSTKKREYFLAGPLLFGNDIIGKFYGELVEGDLILIENVGAYCYNLAWEISFEKPMIVVEK
ncbi:MAG: hypothetical protein AABX16_03945 [Nanoarchaeota archaeon]